MALPKGCVRVGCVVSVVFVVVGTLLSVVGLAAATDDPELLGFDLRPFDVLGLFEATAHELVLEDYAAVGEGADLTVLVVPAEAAWESTDFQVKAAWLEAGDERIGLSVTGLTLAVTRDLSGPSQPTKIRLHAASLPRASGLWTVALDLLVLSPEQRR